MSTYPGETPQTPDDGKPAAPPADDSVQDTPEGTEPTQPVGYWERQAAEQGQGQGQTPGRPQDPAPWQPDPTTAYPQNPQPQPSDPYGQQPNPYAPPAQPHGGQQGWSHPPQQQSGQPYYYPPGGGEVQGPAGYGYGPVAPAHPQSTLALVLGLIGLVGAFFTCGLTLLVSPFAWAIGRKALKEIENSYGRLGGDSQARTGMITGIIGTVLLVLEIIAIIGFIVLIALADSTSPGGSSI